MTRRTRSHQNDEGSQVGNAGQPGGQETTGDAAPVNPVGADHQRLQIEMLQALSSMAQSIRDMPHQILQALSTQSAPPAPQTQPAPTVPQSQPDPPAPQTQSTPSQPWGGIGRSYADFKKCAPAPFSGSSDPIDAERWVRDMEKAFMAHGSQEMERIRFATYLLQGEAYD